MNTHGNRTRECDLCNEKAHGVEPTQNAFYATIGKVGAGPVGMNAQGMIVKGDCCEACKKKIRVRRNLWILMVLVLSTGMFTITLPLIFLFKEVFDWMPGFLVLVFLAAPLVISFWIGLVSIPKRDRQMVANSPYRTLFLSNKTHKPKLGILNFVNRRILAFHLSVDKARRSTAIPLSKFSQSF